jgi:hypothetical protein
MRGVSRRATRRWHFYVLCLSFVALAAPASAIELVASWHHVFDGGEETYSQQATCASGLGRVTSIVSAWVVPAESRMRILDLSPEGSASVSELVAAPVEAGAIDRVYDCLWAANGELLVLVSTEKTTLGALWLEPDLSLDRWTVLVPNGPGAREAQAWATLELRPGQFVTVGHGMLNAFAMRFDKEGAAPRIFPWDEEGAERFLTDVAALGDGFVACGIEAVRGADPQRAELQTVVAAFDAAGEVLETMRMRGGPCALLRSSAGRIRLVHLAYGPPPILRAVTLDGALHQTESDDLRRAFLAFPFEVHAVEVGEALVTLNQTMQFETLEVFRGSARATVAIERKSGVIPWELVGAGSRVVLVSKTHRRDVVRAGVRVDAYTLIDSPPASSVETESPAPPQ